MIARNEEGFLPGCLESVRGIVDEIVLVDTGSTDRTVEIAEAFGAKVFHFPWCHDFAAARNESLLHATGDWLLVLDADERLEASDLRFLEQGEAFTLELVNETETGRQVERLTRLFRNRPHYRYEGKIHEQILPAIQRGGHEALSAPMRILHLGGTEAVIAAKGKRARNIQLLREALLEQPADPYLHFHLGQTLKQTGQLEEAQAHYERALELLERREAFAAALTTSFVDLLLQRGQPAKAIEIGNKGISLYPDHSDLHYELGRALLAENRPEEARHRFEYCLGLGPSPFGSDPGTRSHLALNAIGTCQERLGRPKEAIEALNRAIQASPQGEVESLLNRGILLAKLGRAEAEADFRAVLQVAPDNAAAWQQLGLWAFSRGERKKARSALTRAQELSPSEDIQQLLGILAWDALLDDENPEPLPEVWLDILARKIQAKDFEDAERFVQKSLPLWPNWPDLALGTAETFHRLGFSEVALDLALRIEPLHPGPALYRLLAACTRERFPAEAELFSEKAKDLQKIARRG